MDRIWMYEACTTIAYRDGLRGFMAAAEAHMLREGRADMCCPCKDCGNIRIFELRHIQFHLVKRGFMEGYLRWSKHGEDEAIVSDDILLPMKKQMICHLISIMIRRIICRMMPTQVLTWNRCCVTSKGKELTKSMNNL